MKAIITNTSPCDLPVVQWHGDEPGVGTCTLPAGASVSIDSWEVTRVDIGEVPSYRESLEEFLDHASTALKAVLESLLAQPKMAEEVATISVHLENWGDQDIRALAGANVEESWVKPAASGEIVAPGPTVGAGKWIELLQLGV